MGFFGIGVMSELLLAVTSFAVVFVAVAEVRLRRRDRENWR